MILALDMATITGWTLAQNDGTIVESGVQSFAKKRGESNGLLFLRFRRWVTEMAAHLTDPINLIAYEQAHFRGGAATEICVGLQTRAQELAAERGIESAPVGTMTLKKFATGKGNADKAAMMAQAAVILGRAPIDDNEADAVLVARWAAQEFFA